MTKYLVNDRSSAIVNTNSTDQASFLLTGNERNESFFGEDNVLVAKYSPKEKTNAIKKKEDFDIDRYGVGTKVHTSLVILQECYDMFPEYKHAIAELENEIRWIGNEWRSETVEARVKKLIKSGMAKSLSTIEQVLTIAYPTQAFFVNKGRNLADKKTREIYEQDGTGTDVANAFKHMYWSAYITNKTGEKYARLFTFAHEFGWHNENYNDPEALKMDLHNNQRGRILGEKHYDYELEKAVLDDIDNGNAAIIRNGNSVLNNQTRRKRQ